MRGPPIIVSKPDPVYEFTNYGYQWHEDTSTLLCSEMARKNRRGTKQQQQASQHNKQQQKNEYTNTQHTSKHQPQHIQQQQASTTKLHSISKASTTNHQQHTATLGRRLLLGTRLAMRHRLATSTRVVSSTGKRASQPRFRGRTRGWGEKEELGRLV